MSKPSKEWLKYKEEYRDDIDILKALIKRDQEEIESLLEIVFLDGYANGVRCCQEMIKDEEGD